MNTLDLTQSSSYNPAFITANGGISATEAALLPGMVAGETCLLAAKTPEPATGADA